MSERKMLLEELRSPYCRCGREKQPKHSFCRECFGRLSTETKRALYRRIGCGYEKAHAQALKELSPA